MFVLRDDDRIAFPLRDRDRHDLLGVAAALLRLGRAHLRGVGELVLILTADLEILRDVLGGLPHLVDAILLLHGGIDETPAQRRVVHFVLCAREGFGRLAHHERRPAHAFDAARNHQLGLATLDRARGFANGVETRTAQAIDREAGHAVGDPRQQQRHTSDVAVVLAGLVGATHDHVLDGCCGHTRGLFHEFAQGMRRKVVRPHRRKAAAVTADGSSDAVDDVGLPHGALAFVAC